MSFSVAQFVRLWLVFAFGCGAAVKGTPGDYGEPREWATIQDERILESSGLAPATGDNLLWTNVDGPSGRCYLLDAAGETRAACVIKGVKPTDCEDLASFQIDKKPFLLIADTGDNRQARSEYQLWFVEEPDVASLPPAEATADSKKQSKKKRNAAFSEIDVIGALKFSYPDGSRNCEAICIDVAERTIFLTTKEESGECSVYQLPLPFDAAGKFQDSAKPIVATHVTKLRLPAITGGAMSPDGGRFVLLGRESLFEFLRRKQPDGAWEPWLKTLKQEPTVLTKPKQSQSEAVCFARDGKSLFLSSEGKRQKVWQLPLKAAEERVRK